MISELFENVKVYGRYVRQNKLDGLEYWNRIKLFIGRPEQSVGLNELNTIIGSNWNINVMLGSENKSSNLEKIYDFVHGNKEEQLNICGEEGDEETYSLTHKEWEQNHFFLQLIRIPKNNSLDLIRLLQVAYNLGKLSVCLNDKNFSSKAIEYFNSNNLNDLESYIKLTPEQNQLLVSDLQIKDLITNINTYVLEQLNLIQSGGGNELEPFYSENVEKLTISNNDYRRVLYTGKNQQFVLMSINPGDNIPMETHNLHDQFLRVEQGEAIGIVGKTEYKLKEDSVIIVPAGSPHQIINTGSIPLKLYTIYSPPEHRDKLIQRTNPNKSIGQSDPNDDKYKEKYHHYKNNYIQLKKFMKKYY